MMTRTWTPPTIGKRTARNRISAIRKRVALLSVLLVLAGSSVASQPPKDAALVTIREIRLGVLVTESTVGGRAEADARRTMLLESAEKRLRDAGVRVTRNTAAPYLSLHLTSPNLCDDSGAGPIVTMSATLSEKVTVSRAGGGVRTYADLWDWSDLDVCSTDKHAASAKLVERALNGFLRAVGIDPLARRDEARPHASEKERTGHTMATHCASASFSETLRK